MDNYKVIASKVAEFLPFNGNTMRGFWDGDTYKVLSYSTVIATMKKPNGYLDLWLTENRYSVTTSKHKNIVKKAWWGI